MLLYASKRAKTIGKLDLGDSAQPSREGWPTRATRTERLDSCNSAQLAKSGGPTRTSKIETRLSRDRERHRVQQPLTVQLPLLHERSVQTKVYNPEHMLSFSVSKCTVCMEQFPGLQLHSNATECVRCSRDKNSPKLYSPGNNMDSGSQPLELQIRVLQGT